MIVGLLIWFETMKMFPLNEFVKSLNLNNIGNDDVRKKVIKQILDALDHICPGSYMPYFFIAASGNNGLSLGPTSDKDKESLPLCPNYFT